MRLLFVTPRCFPELSGVATCVHEVARRLLRRGFSVTVLATDPERRYAAREEIDGVSIRRVRAWPANGDLCIAPQVGRVVQSEAWDLVHVQSYQTFVAPVAMWAAWRARIPYLVTFHGGGHSSRFRHRLRPVQLRLLRPLLARADCLVAVARFEISLYARTLALPVERFAYAPNGGDVPTSPGATASRDHDLIVSVGRLERYKGHQRVIEALPHVIRERPGAHVRVLGWGPYESALRRLAQSLGISDRVEICGVPPTEPARYGDALARAGVAVLLSEYETHPISVLNALWLGVPVLVTDTSGLRELARHTGARTIPLGASAEDVATAILELMREGAPSTSEMLPTWDDAATDLESLYRRILAQRGARRHGATGSLP